MPVQALSPPTPQKPKVTLSPCRGLCYCQGLDLHSYTLWVGMENAELESSNPPRISKKMGGLASGEDGISPIPCGSGLENGPILDLHSYTLWVGMENAELESSNPPRISKKNGRSGIRRRRHLSYTLWVGIGEWTKCRHVEWGSECMLDRYSRTLQDAHQIA